MNHLTIIIAKHFPLYSFVFMFKQNFNYLILRYDGIEFHYMKYIMTNMFESRKGTYISLDRLNYFNLLLCHYFKYRKIQNE